MKNSSDSAEEGKFWVSPEVSGETHVKGSVGIQAQFITSLSALLHPPGLSPVFLECVVDRESESAQGMQ